MSEPKTVAESAQEIVPGVWHWHILDDRINFRSDAHAVAADDGVVLIDPLPLEPSALERMGPVSAICLTAACHQRSAWRLRKQFGVQVYAPAGARATDEEADARYHAGDVLPGGLKAVHTPGPESAHYSFLREASPGVLFCSDLLMRPEDGPLLFIPAEYHEDPVATRTSVRQLLDLPFDVLCLDHGPLVTADAHTALRELLDAAD